MSMLKCGRWRSNTQSVERPGIRFFPILPSVWGRAAPRTDPVAIQETAAKGKASRHTSVVVSVGLALSLWAVTGTRRSRFGGGSAVLGTEEVALTPVRQD